MLRPLLAHTVSGRYRPSAGRDWQRPDPPEHRPEQPPRQVALGQQEPVVPGVLDQPPTRLDEALLETCQRRAIDAPWQHQPPPEIPEVVRQHAQL